MSASERDGTGDNSPENWTLHDFFSPIFSLGPSRIQRCIVQPVQTKTRIIRTLDLDELYGTVHTKQMRLRRTGCYNGDR